MSSLPLSNKLQKTKEMMQGEAEGELLKVTYPLEWTALKEMSLKHVCVHLSVSVVADRVRQGSLKM